LCKVEAIIDGGEIQFDADVRYFEHVDMTPRSEMSRNISTFVSSCREYRTAKKVDPPFVRLWGRQHNGQ